MKTSLDHLKELPLDLFEFVVNTGLTVAGVAGTVATVATLGKWDKAINLSFETRHSRDLLSKFFVTGLKIMKPKAKVENRSNSFITSYTTEKLFNQAEKSTKLKRMFYGLATLSAVVTRVADLALGILSALASFVFLGKVAQVNTFAKRNLEATGVFADIGRGFRGMILAVDI